MVIRKTGVEEGVEKLTMIGHEALRRRGGCAGRMERSR